MINLPVERKRFRNLSYEEIDQLKKSQNIAENWDKLFVSKVFNPSLIRNCHFVGENYIGDLSPKEFSFGNLNLSSGFYNSTIKNCLFESNPAIHNVSYLSNYLVEEDSVLFNVNEISCSNAPSFGNGGDKDNRNWIELANENSGRSILPFAEILSADAYLWSKFRDDSTLLKTLEYITDKFIENNRLNHGIIARNCIIKNVRTIEDCRIGSSCIIEGASHLKNCTIFSSADEPSIIGNDVELANSIIGYSNTYHSSAKCFHFISGRNVKIELGARIQHTFVGSNSTIACCEILSNLIFPYHEQHHNNSFLIATTIMGQSNIAAGATIGSNHNSRAADGEIVAKRGFWPGLETNFKHNSFFSSYTLIAKGSYETELNVKLPFSLVSKGTSGMLQIFPAFWFRYNMYALARNSWKFKARDKRKIKIQNIEIDYLAPDTLFEILSAISTIEKAIKKSSGKVPDIDMFSFQKIEDLQNIYLEDMAPKLRTLIIKPLQALWIYKNLVWYAAAKEIVKMFQQKKADIKLLFKDIPAIKPWHNFGGQLISEDGTQQLIEDIKSQKLHTWNDVHKRYSQLWAKYPQQKLKFALACWLNLESKSPSQISAVKIKELIEHSLKINNVLLKWTIESREKDYNNPFRQSTYESNEEMAAVLGTIRDDTFIKQMKNDNKEYLQLATRAISKL